jgi:glycine hydroxymethyltransferase
MYEKEVAEIEQLIQKQDQWRDRCINLIASENVMSKKVRSQAGSDFAHRYAEGHPGERYYRGTSYIDEIENQLKTRSQAHQWYQLQRSCF